jgi:hypothetical protein
MLNIFRFLSKTVDITRIGRKKINTDQASIINSLELTISNFDKKIQDVTLRLTVLHDTTHLQEQKISALEAKLAFMLGNAKKFNVVGPLASRIQSIKKSINYRSVTKYEAKQPNSKTCKNCTGIRCNTDGSIRSHYCGQYHFKCSVFATCDNWDKRVS